MRVVSWNVNFPGPRRAKRLGAVLHNDSPDLVLLQEVNPGSAEVLRQAAGVDWIIRADELDPVVRGASVSSHVVAVAGYGPCPRDATLIAGVPHPFAWGLATGLLGVVPFGAMVVVAGVVLYFLANAATVTALWVAVVGATSIFIADHFVRPHFMAGASRLPLVLALLGIIGGLETFGLLGLFLGPTLLAVMVAVWHELATPAGAAGSSP